MFGCASRHAFAPHTKAGSLHLAPHQLNGFGLRQSEMMLNGVKRRFVIPRHGDDFRYVGLTHAPDLIHHCGVSSAGHVCGAGLHLSGIGGSHEKNNAPRLGRTGP